MNQSVVTRFAPSPTGHLHIGGARTALFNWLFAKARGGRMLLRIEDTDRERSTDSAVDAILEGLSWLGLDWHGEPVSQFARADRHRQIATQMLNSGHAYLCYASPEELSMMRSVARSDRKPPGYDGRWRDRNPDEAPEGILPVVRMKLPTAGETVIDDQVQGRVIWKNETLDDFVILRADGSPTYMLAVVVDDHDMGITHIIRGDDHLTNAARQLHIYNALGWDAPVMAHIPLIHGPDNTKLSKRHGALGVDTYRTMGYLPAALLNYLARLGWSHGDDEVMSLQQMLSWFDLPAIGRASSRFDFVKLTNLNRYYIRNCHDADLVSMLEDLFPYLPLGKDVPAPLTAHQRQQLLAAMPGLKQRAKTLVELSENAAYLFARRPLSMDESASHILDQGGRLVLPDLLAVLEAQNDWSLAALEDVLRRFAEQEGMNLSQISQPLRAALTGCSTSPGIFDVLAVLGKQESLARITDQARYGTT